MRAFVYGGSATGELPRERGATAARSSSAAAAHAWRGSATPTHGQTHAQPRQPRQPHDVATHHSTRTWRPTSQCGSTFFMSHLRRGAASASASACAAARVHALALAARKRCRESESEATAAMQRRKGGGAHRRYSFRDVFSSRNVRCAAASRAPAASAAAAAAAAAAPPRGAFAGAAALPLPRAAALPAGGGAAGGAPGMGASSSAAAAATAAAAAAGGASGFLGVASVGGGGGVSTSGGDAAASAPAAASSRGRFVSGIAASRSSIAAAARVFKQLRATPSLWVRNSSRENRLFNHKRRPIQFDKAPVSVC